MDCQTISLNWIRSIDENGDIGGVYSRNEFRKESEMLVLSRKIGEEILITTPTGESLRVVVVQIKKGGQVRVGIDAPRDHLILRAELEKEDR